MTRTPTTLILDFGGVLTTDLWTSVRTCALHEGLPADTLVDLLHHNPEIHAAFKRLERGDLSQEEFEDQLGAAAGVAPRGLLGRMCAALRPDEAMLDAVEDLRSRGVLIGVLSNSWGSGYFNPYIGYDLERRADAVLISDQVKLRKPDPAIFVRILELLRADAHSAIFVDDVASNLPPAAALGMLTIHHTSATTTLGILEQAFGVPLRFGELPGRAQRHGAARRTT